MFSVWVNSHLKGAKGPSLGCEGGFGGGECWERFLAVMAWQAVGSRLCSFAAINLNWLGFRCAQGAAPAGKGECVAPWLGIWAGLNGAAGAGMGWWAAWGCCGERL